MRSVTYDKFEQRTSIKYGNNVVTNYTYNDSSRNLSNMNVYYTESNMFMNNTYTYDALDNVRSVTNTGLAQTTGIGGGITHTYTYDNLNRLISANGSFNGYGSGDAQKKASYSLSMAYDDLHNITSKVQSLNQSNLQFTGALNAGYTLNYKYNPQNNQQVTEIADTSYRTTGTPVGTPGRQDFTYDANGNLVCINTTREESGSRENLINTRNLLWDEENRLLGVSDNGSVSNYWYDASGERVIKQTGDGEGVLVNGRMSGSRTGTNIFSIYVNPYSVIVKGSASSVKMMSKHIYIGSQRIASQLCSAGALLQSIHDPTKITKAVNNTTLVNYTTKYANLTAKVKTRYDSLNVPYKGTDNNGVGFWSYTGASDEKSNLFFYHPDHLGSSSIITNYVRKIVHHLEYVPFGEVFVDERITSGYSYPILYKFNAKELDEETGLYYYGARYLDPRTSLWLSVDPLAEIYPNVSSYVYCVGNPVNHIDPDGRVVIFINGMHAGSGGKSEYWNGLDNRVMKRIGDWNARYYDGASGGALNTATRSVLTGINLIPGNRRRYGARMGYSQAEDILGNLKDGETVKIVTHSMGGAYGKGFIKGMQKYNKENNIDLKGKIEFEVDLAPYQPGSQKAVGGVPTITISHSGDIVAGSAPVEGAQNNTTRKDHKSGFPEHSVDSFTQQEINKYVPASSSNGNSVKGNNRQ